MALTSGATKTAEADERSDRLSREILVLAGVVILGTIIELDWSQPITTNGSSV